MAIISGTLHYECVYRRNLYQCERPTFLRNPGHHTEASNMACLPLLGVSESTFFFKRKEMRKWVENKGTTLWQAQRKVDETD